MEISKMFRIIGFHYQKLFLLFLLSIFIISCKKGHVEDQFLSIDNKLLTPSGIIIDYPAEATIFPPEFKSPQFIWIDTIIKSGRWYIRILDSNGQELCKEIADTTIWRPDSSVWEKIKLGSAYEPVSLTIIGSPKGISRNKFSSGKISFSISKDSVGASVFYRAVPLPFGYAVKNVDEIEWYMGSIKGDKPHKVLSNIPVCANCHSFSRNGFVAMDIDYANDKGSYIIAPLEDTVHLSLDKIITWSDYKREDGIATYGLLSQISSDGRYVLSTVKDRSVFVALDNLEYSQLFFPIKGIIVVYDRETKRFYELNGASDRDYVQSNPNWSPDGQQVIFCKTERYMSSRIQNSENVLLDIEDVEEFTSGEKEFKFDLYRIAFNEGRGGKALPIAEASFNDKSNFFARYSPDSKWIVFCQAENFMLLQPDSKLYIMPAGGGVPRLMTCNTENMNSWHSWSPNSKWLVFSSKNRGPYTQLYLTHVDENGNDSPPVFLENMSFDNKAANIPEFFDDKHFKMWNMSDDFSKNAIYYNRMAISDIKEKEYKDVLLNLDMAIKEDSTFYDAYRNKFYVNNTLGRTKSKDDLKDRIIADRIINMLIEKNPQDKSLYIKRGELRLLMDDYEGAVSDGLYVLNFNVNDFNGYELLAAVYQKMEKWDKAVSCMKKMQELQPEKMLVIYNLAVLYKEIGKLGQSLNLVNDLIGKNPDEPGFYLFRAGLFMLKRDLQAAKNDYNKAISVDPDNYSCYNERGLFFNNNGSSDLAKNDFEKAIALLGEDIMENPGDPQLLLHRAEIMEQKGDFQSALQEYRNYQKIWPPNYSVLKNEAYIYYNSKQWQMAINTYSIIIDNFPSNADAYIMRGLCFQQSGNIRNALNDYNMAIKMDPDHFEYYFFRSEVRNQLGDKTGRENDLSIAATLLNELRKKRDLNKNETSMLATIQKQLTEK